ncbi:MAG: RNA-binding domain-containing protein [Schleiferilactobacillus harbinensis]
MVLDPEGVRLEYKKAKHSLPKEFWPTYSAFANTVGGTIILGVDEPQPGQYVVTGLEDPARIRTELLNTVTNTNKVSINLLTDDDVLILSLSGKKVLQVTVRPAAYENKPVYLNGLLENSYVRLGDGDHRTTQDQLHYMVANSSEHVDTELLENYTLEDLNLDDVEQYRNLLIENTDSPNLKGISLADFLFNIGCFKIDRTNNLREKKMTAGCLLFFGKYNAITQRFPDFQLDYFRKHTSYDEKWVRRISSGDMNFPELNIFSFYQRVLNVLQGDIDDKYIQDAKMTRGSYYSDMTLAVKEALVNSLMHAYYDSRQPIKVFDYDDYFEFFNPGDMRVSKEEFIHGSNHVSRNSVISILLRRVGIAERAGSGGPIIFKAAEKNHLRVPDIIKASETTTIRLWKVDLLSSLKGLSDTEKVVVSYAVEHNNLFSVKELIKQTPLTDFRARNAVKQLEKSGTVSRQGQGKTTKYYLAISEETGILGFKLMLKDLEDSFNR